VWDGVIALPVIGVLDRARASQMMEKLTAGYLLDIVKAANLLGSRCVLSGISPQIAREMVGIELGQNAIVSFGTLQGALRYAVELCAKKQVPARGERRR
jgi:anti-anti-sigma regulatory factor